MAKSEFGYQLISGVYCRIVYHGSKKTKSLRVVSGQGIPELTPDGTFVSVRSGAEREVLPDGQFIKIDLNYTPALKYLIQAPGTSLAGSTCDTPTGKELEEVKSRAEVIIAGGVTIKSSPSPGDITHTETVDVSEPAKPEAPAEPAEPEAPKYVAPKIDIPSIPKATRLLVAPELWRKALVNLKIGNYLMLLGPKGCGKSLFAKTVAEVLGWDYHEFNMAQAIKPKKFFIGGLALHAGSTEFVESEFSRAYLSDKPTLIFLDEVTRTPAQAVNYTMTIFDKNQSYVYNEDTGVKSYKGKDVFIIAAGNVGIQYTDTRTMDSAFWDRFSKIELDYLPAEKEAEHLIRYYPNAKHEDIFNLVKIANLVRTARKKGGLSQDISTRQNETAASMLHAGLSWADTLDILMNNFINGQTDERPKVLGMIQGIGSK